MDLDEDTGPAALRNLDVTFVAGKAFAFVPWMAVGMSLWSLQ